MCQHRYGSPGNVMKDYKEFAEWFLRTFSGECVVDVALLLGHKPLLYRVNCRFVKKLKNKYIFGTL